VGQFAVIPQRGSCCRGVADCRTGSGSDRMPALNVCAGGFSFDEIDIRRLSAGPGRYRSRFCNALPCVLRRDNERGN